MKISYLGPRGTFSEDAAKLVAGRIEKPDSVDSVELCTMPSLEAIAKYSSTADNSDLGIMAYYNFLEGLVQECLDLIYENGLHVVGMQRVPIEFSIAEAEGNRDHSRVYSHPKALAQCSSYLSEHYPDAQLIPVASTAKSVDIVYEEKGGLAIANKRILTSKGMHIIADDIGNRRSGKSNFTDFYVVSRNPGEVPAENALTMVAVTPFLDRVGLLRDVLAQVAYYNLNIEKIHSRPAIADMNLGNNGEPQMFYLEIASTSVSEDFMRCMSALRYGLMPKGKDLEPVRVLGTYSRPA